MRHVYLDHAATTPVHPEVLEAMVQYLGEHFGNASSGHRWGRRAREGVDIAREQVADLVGARPDEIVFTSGGTEADNLALRGCLLAMRGKRGGLVTAAAEHHAVLETAEELERAGHDVTILGVDEWACVDPEAVRGAVGADTALVSVMLANNEVGTIQPVAEIAEVAHQAGAFMHTDAVQAAGGMAVDVAELGVDLLSLSAHKIYGPKGVGALYVRRGTRLAPIVTGGEQELGRRGGTENVAGIVGMGKACELMKQSLPQESQHLAKLRDRLRDGLLERVPKARFNGHPERRLPNNAHFLFPGALGETVVVALDEQGVAASSGSACATGSTEASHVLTAMGVPRDQAHDSLRLSVGRATTAEDIEYVLEVLPPIVERVRQAVGRS
ncbi:MAG: cysteine desulfurase family protein [Armatimonadota bacterium]